MKLPKSSHSVWAIAHLSPESEAEVHRFFSCALGIGRRFLCKNLHLTVYHSRRRLPGLTDSEQAISVEVDQQYWRFMAIAPGGENPRPDIDTANRPIGVRIQRASLAHRDIMALRARFYPFETREVLGARERSSEVKSAFGSHHYHPHITLLRSCSGIDPDLTKAGNLFRSIIPKLPFDRFSVRCRAAEGGM